MVYGVGAAIVTIGALFKIRRIEIGPLTGGVMLPIGLPTEAIVFAISAFEPVDTDLDWSKVYPELAGGESKNNDLAVVEDEKGLLSQKLDEMLKEARIDSGLMESLGESIRSFEGATKNLTPTTDAMSAQKKYSEEMAMAAAQMESLNSLYKSQVESTAKQAEVNQQVADNASQLKEQMESLTKNLNSLNSVYGGMLNAMSPKA
jgi:gliding motility-associated protein GldL